jgi:hypothetical protein
MSRALIDLLAKIITGTSTSKDFYEYTTKMADIQYIFHSEDIRNLLIKFGVKWSSSNNHTGELWKVKIEVGTRTTYIERRAKEVDYEVVWLEEKQ